MDLESGRVGISKTRMNDGEVTVSHRVMVSSPVETDRLANSPAVVLPVRGGGACGTGEEYSST